MSSQTTRRFRTTNSTEQGKKGEREAEDFHYMFLIQQKLLEYGQKKQNPKEVLRRLGLILERWNPDCVKMDGNYLIFKRGVDKE